MEKFLNVTKNFLKFVKSNMLLILAAFFMLDFIICLFISSPVDTTAKRFKFHTLTLDLLWVFGLFEAWATFNIEGLLNKRITLVSEEVDFIYDTIRKTVEESNKEKKEESADKEEKSVDQK